MFFPGLVYWAMGSESGQSCLPVASARSVLAEQWLRLVQDGFIKRSIRNVGYKHGALKAELHLKSRLCRDAFSNESTSY